MTISENGKVVLILAVVLVNFAITCWVLPSEYWSPMLAGMLIALLAGSVFGGIGLLKLRQRGHTTAAMVVLVLYLSLLVGRFFFGAGDYRHGAIWLVAASLLFACSLPIHWLFQRRDGLVERHDKDAK